MDPRGKWRGKEASASEVQRGASPSGPGSAGLAHEWSVALLNLLHRSGVCVHHNDVLLHQLAGRVAESREGQSDPLHFALVGFLLPLLFQISAPERDRRDGGVSGCVPTTSAGVVFLKPM